MNTDSRLHGLIQACRKGKRASQKELYRQFYNYAMSICLRYSSSHAEAQEIVNDGFMKVFTQLDKYSDSLPFKGWLRRIMINASIDFFRRNEKHYHGVDIVHARGVVANEDSISKLSEEEIMKAVQLLPSSYRMVFNLYVVEGYKHGEIAQKLNISVGTSKSNLAKARMKLKLIMKNLYGETCRNYG